MVDSGVCMKRMNRPDCLGKPRVVVYPMRVGWLVVA
jgi:hypothetical protein